MAILNLKNRYLDFGGGGGIYGSQISPKVSSNLLNLGSRVWNVEV